MKIVHETNSGSHVLLSSGEIVFLKNETNPIPEIEITTEKEFYEIAPEFKKYSCVYINIKNPETEYARLVNNHFVIKLPGSPFRYEEKFSDDSEIKLKQMLKRIGKEA